MSIDPVAFSIAGFAIHWYGLLWLAGCLQFPIIAHIYGKRLLGVVQVRNVTEELMFSCVLGALLGGRIGYVLFYGWERFLADPLWALRLWEGGMSFHGGLVGVILGIVWVARTTQIDILRIGDLVALGSPWALVFVRFGNFINGELWGKPTDLPWGVVFRGANGVARHPSQLYEMIGEGVILFIALAWLARVGRQPGLVAAVFLVSYAVIRFSLEFIREPDAHLGYLALGLTTGQWLSIPMFIVGLGLLIYVRWQGKESDGPRHV